MCAAHHNLGSTENTRSDISQRIFSISDYDFTIMLFCNEKWPPEKYNKALAELTEAKLERQLQEFLFEITGNEKFKIKKLELCEEYIKE